MELEYLKCVHTSISFFVLMQTFVGLITRSFATGYGKLNQIYDSIFVTCIPTIPHKGFMFLNGNTYVPGEHL